MAKKAQNTNVTAPQRVSRPRVDAGPCPASASHKNTVVYKTAGRVRRCKCNDCGMTWKKIGPFADELREYAVNLADSLASTGRTDIGDGPVVMIEDGTAKAITDKLRTLAAS